MGNYIVKIFSIEYATHDVKRYKFFKPQDYSFVPGQATDVSINAPEWKDEKRPFTFTCLNSDPYLEFTIKTYPSHLGVTNELSKLEEGAELIIGDPWGAINYTKPGDFIAAGAGITPFIAIFRHLHKLGKIKGNRLFYSNKTA
ncbi:MAG: FAD-binding oxidoreductase, partial [Bacteroidota bacterium]|nr:FAD-binding oxidoreductase [Bacteroidota bacterium]